MTVNADGDPSRYCVSYNNCSDTYPRITVYVNGTAYNSYYVTSSTQNYTLNVTLPSSDPVNVDVFFSNDEYYSDSLGITTGYHGDRNLRINSVTIESKTFSPTDSGVIEDIGWDYTTATDGINTQVYGTGPWGVAMFQGGALRISTTLAEVTPAATLVAEYHFEEETAWNGTSDELKDSAGYSSGPFDGEGDGSPIATQADTAPAISGSNGTCSYSTFNGSISGGSVFRVDNLPVDTSNGSKTSVSFWMYWDGSNYVMPIGWHRHDLWFASGAFGFNTWNSDIYGISSSGLSNGWHHVVAVFTNGNVTQNQLYIDGVNQSLSLRRGSSVNNSRAYVQSTMYIGGVGVSTYYRFYNSLIDEVKVYNGALTQAQVTADYTETHLCPGAYELLAEYHLDETSWNGATGEVEDTAGYSSGPFDGVTIGSPLPNANHTDRARSGASGTCGYAELNGPASGGGALSFSSIPFDTSTGSKNSMSFWMYWDGTDNVLPASSNGYGLILENNHLGFTAGSGGLYGVNASSLTNGWHHISAVFNQGDYTQNKLYINGGLQSLSQITAKPRTLKAYFDAGTYYSGSSNSITITPNSPWSSDNPSGYIQIHSSSNIGLSGSNRSVFDLERDFGDASNLKATVSTTPGDRVYVSFETAERPGYYSSDLQVYINNNLIATVGTNSLTMQAVEYSAVTNTSSTLIEFRATDNDGYGPLMDEIRIETVSNSEALNQSVQVGGTTASSAQRLVGRADEVKFYRGEIDQTQVTADYNATHACPSYVVNVDAHDFNCIAEQETDLAAGHLYMQLAGQPFNIQVIALRSDNTAETDFSALSDKNVTLEFLDQVNGYTPVTFNDGSDVTSKTLTFTSSNTTGILPVNGLVINQAHRNLICRITDANQSPTIQANSSNAFSVRPSGFTVTSSDATADSTGTNANATPTIVAGAAFSLTASTDTVGYDGTPQFDSSRRNAHAGANKKGTLTGTFPVANSVTGNSTSTNFVYEEVGYIKINTTGVYDTAFTAIDRTDGDCVYVSDTDASSYSNNASSGKYGCGIRNATDTNFFGRFIPNHFDVGGGSRVTTAECGGAFTYYGQDGLTTQFEIRAENLSGTLLRNYHGAYAKLDLTTWTDTSSATGLRFSSPNLPTGVTLSASTPAPSGVWNEGLATVTAKHQLSRPASPVSPVSLELESDMIDSDGVGPDDGTAESINQSSDSVFRYGKLTLSNAYGSELHKLSIPLQAEYWDGNAYRKNTEDNCTVINPVNMTMDSYQKNLNACETDLSGGGTMSAGALTFSLSEPGNGNNGSVTLTPNLTSASGSVCVPTASSSPASSAGLSWFGASPAAKATFGLNKTPIIYFRENF